MDIINACEDLERISHHHVQTLSLKVSNQMSLFVFQVVYHLLTQVIKKENGRNEYWTKNYEIINETNYYY